MFRKPALLDERHRLDEFDSGRPVLDAFLKQMALHSQVQGYTRTFVIADTEFRVVGYHSLCAAMIARDMAPHRSRGIRRPEKFPSPFWHGWRSIDVTRDGGLVRNF